MSVGNVFFASNIQSVMSQVRNGFNADPNPAFSLKEDPDPEIQTDREGIHAAHLKFNFVFFLSFSLKFLLFWS
jgi:hypothetical protein